MEKEKIKKGIMDEETKENKEKIVKIEEKSEKENKTEVKKVCEILDLKTETRNIFKMSDGSYKAEIYPVEINENLNK